MVMSNGVVVLLLETQAAHADIIYLTNGRKIHGRILKKKNGKIIIETAFGKVSFSPKEIKRLVRESDLDFYINRGKSLEKKRSYGAAIKMYRKAAALPRGALKGKSYYLKAHLNHATYLYSNRVFKRAHQTVTLFLGKSPGHEDGLALKAKIDAELNSYPGKLLKALRHFKESKPKNENLYKAKNDLDDLLSEYPEMRKEVGEKLAIVLVHLGDNLITAPGINSDITEEAAQYFQEAMEFDPNVTEFVSERYVFCKLYRLTEQINQGIYEDPLRTLKEILEFAPGNADALYYQGAIFQQQGKLKKAIASYSQIEGLRGRNDLPKDVQKLRKKAQKMAKGKLKIQPLSHSQAWKSSEAGDFKKLEMDEFVIFHHNQMVAEKVKATLLYELPRVRKWLSPDHKPATWEEAKTFVYIYRNREEYVKHSGELPWSGGVTRLKTIGNRMLSRSIMSYQDAPGLIKSIIPHELTHAVLPDILGVGVNLPLWANEGLAVSREPDFKHHYFKKNLKFALAKGVAFPLEDFLSMKKYPSKESVDLYYATAFGVTQILLKKESMQTFFKFVKEASNSTPDKLLQKYYNKNIDSLEREWRATYQ